MSTALVVIDVQGYFLQQVPELPTKIAEHISESNYDCLAFTIFQNADGSNWERSLHWSKCKDGSDIVLAAEFNSLANDRNTFVKQAYSAFKNNDFEAHLQANNVTKIKLCGIDLEDCVLATAFEAFDKGYEVEVLFDLCYSRNSDGEAARAIIMRDIQSRNNE